MIPTTTDVLAAVPFLARLHDLDATEFNERAVAAALEEARTLAADGRDEAAAVFFALARRAHVLRSWWPALTFDLAAMIVRQAGGPALRPFAEELRTLRLRIARREAAFDDARAWFASRT